MADQRLINLLGGPALATLRKRLRRRFAQSPSEGHVDSFRLTGLSHVEYDALAQLQGLPARRAHSIVVDVAAIDAALHNAGIAADLKNALERIDGPIIHIPTDRLRMATRWSQVTSSCPHAALRALIDTAAGFSLLKRIAKQNPATAMELIEQASAVLHRLPAPGIPRALLAAETLGDPHALDSGYPVANLVLSVWRAAAAEVDETAAEAGLQKIHVRDIWAKAGVLVNELARPALFLNLPTDTDSAEQNQSGEPTYISLRRLLRTPPDWHVSGRDVFVCENPNVLAIIADRLGSRSAPLVCTDGMPSAAQQALLFQLARSGAQLHYHGDFDWPGLRIGNYMFETYAARPWRFGATDYVAAAQIAYPRRQHLRGSEAVALWDTDLTAAMRTHQMLVSEEDVVDQLLPDLD